jgi:hypothetical protein
MEDLARDGIGKDRKNTQQGYSFRGIDDVYNALAPVLARQRPRAGPRHRLTITPTCLARDKEVVPSKNGGSLFYVTVDMEFRLTSAVDGSGITARMFGEAMDSGDKATNKAMSAAYKYMAMQQFCIPTEGDNDPDATTHQLASAEELAINLLQLCKTKDAFKETWEKNKDGWRKVMAEDAYARVVAVMKQRAAIFTRTASLESPPPPEQPKNDFGIGDDEIPF